MVATRETKPLLALLNGETLTRTPIWLMRQAGRYLPEYRATRERAGGFLDLCFNPVLAAEVTLQPIERFGFDGAILFSDILVIPLALGQRVWFETGEGPRLDSLPDRNPLGAIREEIDPVILAPVYETIGRVKAALPHEVTFLGFCGAPWTLATYMIAGRGGDDQMAARLFAYRDPDGFSELIERLTSASIAYLIEQVRAGVDVVQIFDTWAGILGPTERERWCISPVRKIVAGVRSAAPHARIIAFPRGIGTGLAAYVESVEVDAIGLDWMINRTFVRRVVPDRMAVQGNLDPAVLMAGGCALDDAISAVLGGFRGRRHIFNLGHGILPQTPIAHVEQLVRRVRGEA